MKSLLEFIKQEDNSYMVFNSKTKVDLGKIEIDKDWNKPVFLPSADRKFSDDCQQELADFLAKLNAEKKTGEPFNLNTKVGRPRLGKIKHGFYVDKMRPCSKCPKQLNGTCPYFYVIKGMEHMHQHMHDEFGVNRCVPEYHYFNNLLNSFKEDYDFKRSDLPLVEKMCMILVRASRVEQYIADQGLTQIRTLKDDRTGELRDAEMQNLLKKDAYFDDKMFREWLELMRVSRKDRKEIDTNDDIAIVLTTEKKLTIKGKRKSPEEIEKAIAEIANATKTESGA